MKIVRVNEKRIKGMRVRTKNTNEMNPEKAKISGLWQQFEEKLITHMEYGGMAHGVYYDYESDATGLFSVLAGSDQISDSYAGSLEEVTICSGNYMVFEAKGNMPQVVIDTWSEIWEYFSNENAQYKRAYRTDFELYKGQNEIEIYIAVLWQGEYFETNYR